MILDRLAVWKAKEETEDVVLSSSRAFKVGKPKTRKRQPLHKIRIALPRIFTDCVWEFGLQGSENGWEMQLHPVNERPWDSFVFNVVQSGCVSAIRALLESGDLSMRDHAAASQYLPCRSLLDVRSQRLSIDDEYLF
jgi:hypothetical protein